MVRNFAWIFPEVLITLRSVKAKIQSVKNQYSSDLESDQFGIIETGLRLEASSTHLSNYQINMPDYKTASSLLPKTLLLPKYKIV